MRSTIEDPKRNSLDLVSINGSAAILPIHSKSPPLLLSTHRIPTLATQPPSPRHLLPRHIPSNHSIYHPPTPQQRHAMNQKSINILTPSPRIPQQEQKSVVDK